MRVILAASETGAGESLLSKTLTQTKVKSGETTVPRRALASVCEALGSTLSSERKKSEKRAREAFSRLQRPSPRFTASVSTQEGLISVPSDSTQITVMTVPLILLNLGFSLKRGGWDLLLCV